MSDNIKWLPGKGFFGHLNEDTLDFLNQALEDVYNAAGGEGELNELLDTDKAAEFLKNIRGSAAGWRPENDNFGVKVYKELDMGEDARGNKQKYRVTVVLPKRGHLSIDIRQWYSED